MSDYADLEAEMTDEIAKDARTEKAHHRAAHGGDHLTEAWNREAHRNAVRTLQLHGTPALHDHLLDLENQVIDLLHPDDRDYFRSRQ